MVTFFDLFPILSDLQTALEAIQNDFQRSKESNELQISGKHSSLLKFSIKMYN